MPEVYHTAWNLLSFSTSSEGCLRSAVHTRWSAYTGEFKTLSGVHEVKTFYNNTQKFTCLFTVDTCTDDASASVDKKAS